MDLGLALFILVGTVFAVLKIGFPLVWSNLRPGPTRVTFQAYSKKVRLWVGIIFSFLVLIAALYIIIFTKDLESQKWAFGAVGMILGFWLK